MSADSEWKGADQSPTITSPLHTRDREDSDCTSIVPSYVTLSAEEKEWMVASATADYHGMFRLLATNSHLLKLKDIANGYTALHWACKLGQPEVVKMLANRIGVNVNQQSHGGYTPMHLAAMQGHFDIMELLLNVYKADPNIRDNSGRKPRYYLHRPPATHTTIEPPHHFSCYSEEGWDIVFTPALGASLPRSTHVIRSSISKASISDTRNSSSSSLQLPVVEGVDVLQDGEEMETEDWVLL